MAHRQFHEILADYDSDPKRWEEVAERFRATMTAAIAADPQATGCRPELRAQDATVSNLTVLGDGSARRRRANAR